MSFAATRSAMRASVFSALGVAALWKAGGADPGVAVMVRLAQPDQLAQGAGGISAVVSTNVIRVRAADVAEPAEGDVVQITDADHLAQYPQALFRVFGEAMREKRGDVWACQVQPVAP